MYLIVKYNVLHCKTLISFTFEILHKLNSLIEIRGKVPTMKVGNNSITISEDGGGGNNNRKCKTVIYFTFEVLHKVDSSIEIIGQVRMKVGDNPITIFEDGR